MGKQKKSVVPDKIIFYHDKSGDWRWKRVASNGKIIGASSEGYKKKSYCEVNFYRQLWTNYTIISDL